MSENLPARECDFAGVWTLLAFFALNFPIVYLTYRHNPDRASAGFRTLALCAGLPMLYALERGNLIIPCFTFFALGYGKVLRSAKLRWIAVAFTVNFKPYLVLTLLPQLFRRRWTRRREVEYRRRSGCRGCGRSAQH